MQHPVSLSGCSDEAQQNHDHIHVRHPECREFATSTSEELDVDSKQFHDTGNCRNLFTKIVYDPEICLVNTVQIESVTGISHISHPM